MKDFNITIDNDNYSGIVVVVDKHQKIMKANKIFLNLLGYRIDEIIGKPLADLIIPDEKSLFFELFLKKDIATFKSLKFYHKSGAFRYFSITLLDLLDYKIVVGNSIKKEYSATKYVHLNNIHLGEHNLFKNIESENIRDLISFDNNAISLLLNLLPIEVWIKDKLGKYIFVNDKYSTAISTTNKEIFMKDDFQCFDSEVAKAFLATDNQAIESGKSITFSFETDSKYLRGFAEVTKIPIFNKFNEYIGILGFSIDTTNMKSTEKGLYEKIKRNEFIFENAAGIIFELNSQGDIIFASGKLAKKFKFEVDESEYLSAFDLKDRSSELYEKVTLALNGTEVSFTALFIGKDINFNLIPVKNVDKSYNVIGYGKIASSNGDYNE